MASNAIRIAILANAAQAKKELDSVSTKGQKFSKALGGASKIASVGLLAVGAAAVKAGRAAAEDEASQSKLAQTLRTAAGASTAQIASTENWITAQGKALGVTDDELRPALSKLAIATGSVSQAQKAASLAMNISAGSGKELGTVSQAIAKAYSTGSVTALGKYGVATKDAAGKTRSLAAITKDLATKYQGAAAKSAETTAGKQKILTVQMGELQEQIGAGLLPVMAKLATAGLAAVAWASKHGAAAKILLGVLVGLAATVIAVNTAMKVATAGQAVYTAVTATAAGVQGLLGSACLGTRIGLAALAVQTALTSAVTKAAAVAQWALNAAMTANPIGLVIVAIVALVAIFVLAWKNSETFRNIVIGAWNAIKAATSAVWGAIKATISAVFVVMKTIIVTYIGIYVTVVKAAWTAIRVATSAVWGAIKVVVGAVLGAIVTVIRTTLATAKAVVSAAWNAVKTATSAVWQGIKTAVRNEITGVMIIVRGIKGKITGVFSGAATWLINAGKSIISGLISGITGMAGKVVDAVKGVLSKARNLLPFSPAKTGPFSGRGWTLYSGRSISLGLAAGIRSRTSVVHGAALDLAKAAIPVTQALNAGKLDVSAATAYTGSVDASRELNLTLSLSAQQVSQLQRGRELKADMRAYEQAGGR